MNTCVFQYQTQKKEAIRFPFMAKSLSWSIRPYPSYLLLSLPPSTSLSLSLIQPHWPPHCSPNMSYMLPPQDLCICSSSSRNPWPWNSCMTYSLFPSSLGSKVTFSASPPLMAPFKTDIHIYYLPLFPFNNNSPFTQSFIQQLFIKYLLHFRH
jgi:hypothetical protein